MELRHSGSMGTHLDYHTKEKHRITLCDVLWCGVLQKRVLE